MSNQQTLSNKSSNGNELYKICVGKLCNKPGTNRLHLRYINRDAWFCNSCKKELQEYGLIDNN